MQASSTTDVQALSLGGVPPDISKNDFYHTSLRVFEYEGCIRNLKINGQWRNLKLNKYNLAVENCDCKYQANPSKDCINTQKVIVPATEFPWWIILIVIAALILLGKLNKNEKIFFKFNLNQKVLSYSNKQKEKNNNYSSHYCYYCNLK